MKVHQLKIDYVFWHDLVSEKKTAELRKDDRGYQVGDVLVLKAFVLDAEDYEHETPEETRIVTHIVQGGQYGIEAGYCMLSMAKPEHVEINVLR
jgi:hypothetical protein